jgi:hypothetical protein
VSNVESNRQTLAGGPKFRTDLEGDIHTPAQKIQLGTDGTFSGFVGASNPLPVTDPHDDITQGNVTGASQWNKFGYRTATTAVGGDETIWATNTNHTILTSASTFTITYNSTTDGAGGGATGGTIVQFYYLDANEELSVAVHVLGSDGSDVTSFTGLGINRAVVVGSGTADSNVNDITITATTGGSTQAIIPAGQGVTQQAIFFMPNNAIGATKMLMLNANNDAGGQAPFIRVKGWVYNRTVSSQFEIFRYLLDTSVETSFILIDPVNFAISPRDVLFFTADTDRDNTEITCRFSLHLYDTA